jgi:hypothetical protein
MKKFEFQVTITENSYKHGRVKTKVRRILGTLQDCQKLCNDFWFTPEMVKIYQKHNKPINTAVVGSVFNKSDQIIYKLEKREI